MASNIDRWEKDPFFSAAEEVQDSADRMESAYRIWIHESKDASSICNQEELLRDVHTTIGTAKWQLEEFERAVKSSYDGSASMEDAKTRHHQFIAALDSQVTGIENLLNKASLAEGKPSLTSPWTSLDEGERDELTLFLLGSSANGNGNSNRATVSSKDEKVGDLRRMHEEMLFRSKRMHDEAMPDCLNNSRRSVERGSKETREERPYGHRRTASASADIGASLKVETVDDSLQRSSFDGRRLDQPPPRILSFSGFLSTAESMPKLQCWKNGFRKWRLKDLNQEVDVVPLQPQQIGRGMDSCYERNKSSLNSCDDSYNKQLYGWLGAFQRQLRRSQYQLQYSRPVQVVFWMVLVLCLIVFFAFHAI